MEMYDDPEFQAWRKAKESATVPADPEFEAWRKATGRTNPFDVPEEPPVTQNSSFLGDVGTGLKRGVEQIPGMVTGLADIVAAPISAATGINRPFSRAADWAGKKTGFQPGKWADDAAQEYSPAMQEQLKTVEDTKGFWNSLGTYATNPRALSNLVVESLPGTALTMGAGKFAAQGLMGAEKYMAARAAASGADDVAAAAARKELLKHGAIGGGIGEGVVTAGSQMDNTDYDVDPLRAAGSALMAGVGTGILGVAGGKVANRMGLPDIDTAYAAGTLGDVAKGGVKATLGRVGIGAAQEGIFEELPQSMQEQIWQNVANGKQWNEGVMEAGAAGLAAGTAMGGSINALPRGAKPAADAEEKQPVNLLGYNPAVGTSWNNTIDPNPIIAEGDSTQVPLARFDILHNRELGTATAETENAQLSDSLHDSRYNMPEFDLNDQTLPLPTDPGSAVAVIQVLSTAQTQGQSLVEGTPAHAALVEAQRILTENGLTYLANKVAAPAKAAKTVPVAKEPAAAKAEKVAQPIKAVGKDAVAFEVALNNAIAENPDDEVLKTTAATWNAGKKTNTIAKELKQNLNVAGTNVAVASPEATLEADALASGMVKRIVYGKDAEGNQTERVEWIKPEGKKAAKGARTTDNDQVAPEDVEDQTIAEGIRMFQAGDTLRTIASNLGGSHTGWSNVLAQYGYTVADRDAELAKYALDTKAAATTETPEELAAGAEAKKDVFDSQAEAVAETPEEMKAAKEAEATDAGTPDGAPSDYTNNDEYIDNESENVGVTVRSRMDAGGATAATTDAAALAEMRRAWDAAPAGMKARITSQLKALGVAVSSLKPPTRAAYLDIVQKEGRTLTAEDVATVSKIDAALKPTAKESKLAVARQEQKDAISLADDSESLEKGVESLLSGDVTIATDMLQLLGGKNGIRLMQWLRSHFGMPASVNTPKAAVEYFVGKQSESRAEALVRAEQVADLWGAGFDKLTDDQKIDFAKSADGLGDLVHTPSVLRQLKEEINGTDQERQSPAASAEGTESNPAEAQRPDTAGTGEIGTAQARTPEVKVRKKRTIEKPGVALSEGQGAGIPASKLSNTLRKLFFSPTKFDQLVTVVQSIRELKPQDYAKLSQADDPTKVYGFTSGGKVVLIADNIPAGKELAVFLHEAGVHLGMENLIGKANMERLSAQVEKWAAKNDGSQESEIAKRAVARAKESSSSAEFLPEENIAYFIEEAVAAGIDPYAIEKMREGALKNWFRTLWAAAKVALRKIGFSHFDTLTAQEMVDLAYGAAQKELSTETEVGASKEKIKFSQAGDFAEKVAGTTGRQIVDDTSNTLKKAAYSLGSLHDLVEEFNGKLKSAKEWYKSVQATIATRKQLEEDAEKIAFDAGKLKNGTQKVNEFISKSTYEQKWGYAATFPKLDGTTRTVTPDSGMASEFRKLSPEEQAVVKAVFAHSEKMALTRFQMMKDLGLTDVLSEGGKLDGPYAPLKRFGNFVGMLKSKELLAAEKAGNKEKIAELKANPNHYVVSYFDTKGQAMKFARANQSKWSFTDAFEGSTRVDEGRVMKPEILQKVLSAARMNEDIDPVARNAYIKMVQDLYLQSIDEHNARTSGMKRLNRAGYDEDMIRSFLSQARAEAGFLANMKHGGETNDQFYKMQQAAKDETSGKRVAQDEFNALAKHYAENLKYEETPWQDRAMALTSAWQLATSVGYHVTNAMQGIMVTVPKLAADFNNYGGAWNALMNGYRTLAQTGWKGGALDLSKVKNEGLRKALQLASDMGVLDVGMEEDLTHFEAFRTGYGSVDKTSKVARTALHKLRQVSRAVETANRVSAATAGYNMSIASGKSVEEAQDYAIRILQTTQGDFSRVGAPLLLKKLPKAMTQYRKYQFMMAALYTKAFRDAFMGEDAETKAIGRRMLGFKLFHTSMAAGVLGMPLMNLAAMVFSAAGGDDEPKNLERTLREAIGDETTANLLLHGPLAMAGLDMSGKLGDDKIFSIMPYGKWDFSSAQGVKDTLFGLAGPAASQAGKFADGVGFASKGEYYKSLEKFMPKGISDGMKAFRIANEGYSLKNGDVMVKPEDINGFALALDAIGMPSSELKRMDWIRSQQYEIKRFYIDQSKEIQQEYSSAAKDKDTAKMAELRQEWLDLQKGKDHMRQYFDDRSTELKRQPLSSLIAAPMNQAKRERKLQLSVPD